MHWKGLRPRVWAHRLKHTPTHTHMEGKSSRSSTFHRHAPVTRMCFDLSKCWVSGAPVSMLFPGWRSSTGACSHVCWVFVCWLGRRSCKQLRFGTCPQEGFLGILSLCDRYVTTPHSLLSPCKVQTTVHVVVFSGGLGSDLPFCLWTDVSPLSYRLKKLFDREIRFGLTWPRFG